MLPLLRWCVVVVVVYCCRFGFYGGCGYVAAVLPVVDAAVMFAVVGAAVVVLFV